MIESLIANVDNFLKTASHKEIARAIINLADKYNVEEIEEIDDDIEYIEMEVLKSVYRRFILDINLMESLERANQKNIDPDLLNLIGYEGTYKSLAAILIGYGYQDICKFGDLYYIINDGVVVFNGDGGKRYIDLRFDIIEDDDCDSLEEIEIKVTDVRHY